MKKSDFKEFKPEFYESCMAIIKHDNCFKIVFPYTSWIFELDCNKCPFDTYNINHTELKSSRIYCDNELKYSKEYIELYKIEYMLCKKKPRLNIITKFPTKKNGYININHKHVACLYFKEESASLYLNRFTNGAWYDEDGNEIAGFLHYKSNKKK